MTLLFLLSACVFVSAEDHALRKAAAGVDSGPVDTDTDTDTESDTDVDTGSPWAGTFAGSFDLVLDDGILDTEDCEGSLEVEVFPDGRVEGAATCDRETGGTIAAEVSGTAGDATASGTLAFTGDLQDTTGWTGFLVDSQGGTITASFEGTAQGGVLGGTDYSGAFEGVRTD